MLCLYSLNLGRGGGEFARHLSCGRLVSVLSSHQINCLDTGQRYPRHQIQSRYSLSTVMAKVCVVLGSVREGRMGERVARMVGEKIYCYVQSKYIVS